MPDQSLNYFARVVTAVTSLNSLTDGSFASSATIVNTTNLGLDIAVGGVVVNGTGTGSVRVYALAQENAADVNSVIGGFGAFTISDATKLATLFNIDNIPLLTTISYDGASKAQRWGPYVIGDLFGFQPEIAGVLFENVSGQTLAASGHSLAATYIKTTV